MSPASPAAAMSAPSTNIHRVEVRPRTGHVDPLGDSVLRDAKSLGLLATRCRASHIYLIAANLSPAQLESLRTRLLADPVIEEAAIGATPAVDGSAIVEVHPLPGVMDPAAESVVMAIHDLLGIDAEVSTGWRYDIEGITSAQAEDLAKRLLANPVIQRVTTTPYHPTHFPRGVNHEHSVRHIPISNLDDAQLERLSRDAHLFLSLDEMKAIQSYYRARGAEPREIELETLAQTWSEHCVHKTLKSRITYRSGEVANLQSGTVQTVNGVPVALGGSGAATDPINWASRPGHTINADGSITINNLLKSTVAAATFELIADGVDWTLSVFTDNSGVIAFDDHFGVCIKVETHNHPSAIEPYGGAATGIGGCIRDVIGTGLGARPIASTDVFCVAHPDHWAEQAATDQQDSRLPLCHSASWALPQGCLPPKRILTQVVAGVRDYGNRMGIPTVSGGVFFDDNYIGNPLVFCGCIGLIPRRLVRGAVQPGDRIIALGGRTGRDGIHGATFSSAELEHSAADEFSHAVQIGNAITEKRVLDAIMRARDDDAVGRDGSKAHPNTGPLYNAMTDCGAGGFSSAVGEMASKLGAEVHLDRAPLKYPGLSSTEIWISEAQERIVLAVPQAKLARLKQICAEESVELADLGHFGTPDKDLVLLFRGEEVGRIAMNFLHDGVPTPMREAMWVEQGIRSRQSAIARPMSSPLLPIADSRLPHAKDALLALLSHPNIASKHWIIRQYDHEVRGGTIIKPLVGRAARGPGDGAVIEPVPGTGRGVAISQGLQTGMGNPAIGGDPYLMTLAAIDECVRNLVCVGADPDRIAILDNFCWPSCKKPENLGSLVRAAEACYDGAKAYRTPFVSGKDSLNNQFTTHDGRTIEIPPTLLITGIGIVPDVHRCVTSDAKKPGHTLLLIGPSLNAARAMGGSHYQQLLGLNSSSPAASSAVWPADAAAIPVTDLKRGPLAAALIAKLIREGLVAAAHDVSDGGLLCTIAEMLIGGALPGRPIGAHITLDHFNGSDLYALLFSECPSRYVVEVTTSLVPSITSMTEKLNLDAIPIAELNSSGVLTLDSLKLSAVVGDLAAAWRRPLDW